MQESISAYVVAVSMLLFCGVSALTMFWVIDHADPPDVRDAPEHRHLGV